MLKLNVTITMCEITLNIINRITKIKFKIITQIVLLS